ncbi:MAG: condensation domain-containing protein, partial [Segetibacter sp.]
LPVEILDYRHMDPEERAAALKQFETTDRAKPFEFAEAPLMRVALIRLTDERFHMLWTSHHILFDGWSLPIMMEGFLSGYETLVAGKEIVSEEEDRYEDYIRHIDRGNREQEETYWRNYMQGVEQSTLLPFIGTTTERTKGAGIYKSIYFQVDAERTEKIQAFGQKHHITINTIMQGVWSSLLHNYTGNDDIVFGVIVAGRPDVLTNVEKRVGLYINTLPLHSNISEDQEILSWLQRMQDEQVASRRYEHTPLHQIQALTGVNGDLFDSLLVFENYPVSKVVGAREWSLQVENVQVNEQTNYPLTIIISSSDQITVQFTYNTGLLSEAYAKEILGHFEYT